MSSEIDLLRQENIRLMTENAEAKDEITKLKTERAILNGKIAKKMLLLMNAKNKYKDHFGSDKMLTYRQTVEGMEQALDKKLSQINNSPMGLL
ncbi:3937_t:CDS:1, partial [Funneliformis geosporum]